MTTYHSLLFNCLPIVLACLIFTPDLSAHPPATPDFSLTIDCSRTNDPFFVGGEGDATIAVSDGTPPYSVTWSGPVNGTGILDADGDFRIDGLLSGDYVIIVQDLEGAVQNCNFTLSERDCNLEVEFIGIPPECAGSATGAFVAIFNSQTAISWTWSDENNTSFRPFWYNVFGANGLKAGTYSATITDFFGCAVSETITLNDPPALEVDCGSLTHPSSPFINDGIVQPLLSGGTLPYQISWDGAVSGSIQLNNPTNFQISDLPAGDYELYVTDANGCSGYCNFVLGQSPDCELTLRLNPTHLTCNGNRSGSIEVVINGGSGAYDFDWSNDLYDNTGTLGSISELAAGLYELTVTDTEGCRATASVMVHEPAPFTINCGVGDYPSQSDSLDGRLSVTMGAGAPSAPYTFYYTDNMGFSDTLMEPYYELNDYSIIVTDKVYDITVESAAGCRTSCQVDMSIPDCERRFLRASLQGPSCPGESDGTLFLQIQNGNAGNYTFAWNHPQYDGQDSLHNLPTGIYRVTATSPTGCVDIQGYGIIDSPPLILSCTDTVSPSAVGAADGRNLLTLIGGNPPYTLSWNGPVSGSIPNVFPEKYELTGLPAGEYQVSMIDLNGCTTQCSFFITDLMPPCVLPVSRQLSQTLCAGESIVVGSETFDEARPSGSVLFPNGTAEGCDSLVEVSLTFRTQVVRPFFQELCPGERLVINNEVFDEQRPSGSVIFPNAALNGCDSLIEVSLSYTEQVAGQLMEELCAGGSLSIGNQLFDENRPGGNVVLPGAAASGCDSLVQVNLTFRPPAESLAEPTLCWGETYTIGNETFDIDRSSGLVTLSTSDGCDSLVRVELNYLPEQTANLYGDTAYCRSPDQVQLRLEVTDQLDYSFLIRSTSGEAINDFGEGTTLISVNPLSTETYVLEQVNSGNNCPITIAKDRVRVTLSDPQVNIKATSDYNGFPVSCPAAQDGNIWAEVQQAMEPLSYQWNTGHSTAGIDDLAAGVYHLMVTDQLGCIGEDSIRLEAPLPLLVSAQGQAPGCRGNDVGLIRIEDIDGGAGTYTYQLGTGPFLPIAALPLEINSVENAGVYLLTIEDENGCRTIDSVMVPEGIVLTLDLGPDQQLEWGDSLQLIPQLNFTPSSWTWTPVIGLSSTQSLQPLISPQETTSYTLTAADENGCIVSGSVRVFVSTQIDIFIPNAFSPDGNGTNDRLTVFTGPEVVSVDRFEVFDRWGNQVFSRQAFTPNDLAAGWDGTAQGRPLNTGMYVYSAQLSLIDGRTTLVSGEVYLIR